MGKKRARINTINGASFDLLWQDLTRTERRVYETMAEYGYGASEIATRFNRSSRTIEKHLENIFAKFGFSTTPKAIAAYYKNKIEKLTAK
jgi:DNA-binding CsgD family transcriptional regulator